METGWPFFFLVANRPALVKVDVSAPSGTAVPTGHVTARWPDGRSETLCLRSPAALPAAVDMRPQPLKQDLGNSYALALPAAWLRPGLALSIDLDGGATVSRSASELKVGASPELTLVIANMLLFGDTRPQPMGDELAEFGSKLPISGLRVATLPFDLALPRLVIPPRGDSLTPNGATQSTPAQWADRMPSCTPAQKAAGTCVPYSGYGILTSALALVAALQRANGMTELSLWYGALGLGSGLGGGLGGSSVGIADGFGLPFNHEMGHAMGLPHLGSVTGARQTSPTALMHPYVGETVQGDGQPLGGGFGRTAAYDPLDHGIVQAVCADTALEQHDPMQRSCNTLRAGRKLDHFSDSAIFKLLRYFNGDPDPVGGTVPYFSRLLPGSSAEQPVATRFQFPSDWGRAQATVDSDGTWTVKRWSATANAYVQLQRPPGGDAGFLDVPPPAPAGQRFERYYDFKFPQEVDVPVFTVFGTFNVTDDATSTIYDVRTTRGNLMRLWEPARPEHFDLMRRGTGVDGFRAGYDLHLRVTWQDGSVRTFAMPWHVSPTTDPMKGFATWAFNVPDDGRALDRVELLYRPLCVYTAGISYSCNIGLPSNGITAANVYDRARVAARWIAPR
ncbi:M66 family metalloprotease [Aquincola sp. MAHUQ-54]|uniref:M66 family metalloprotease n=1 Tax=Aquincola agrisoli TaxID=3119538 RepID=A0AAW9QPX4_9BURK